jgi:hypothetical protein
MSLTDFRAFCRDQGIGIERTAPIGAHRRVKFWPNLLALNGIFLIKKNRVQNGNE